MNGLASGRKFNSPLAVLCNNTIEKLTLYNYAGWTSSIPAVYKDLDHPLLRVWIADWIALV